MSKDSIEDLGEFREEDLELLARDA